MSNITKYVQELYKAKFTEAKIVDTLNLTYKQVRMALRKANITPKTDTVALRQEIFHMWQDEKISTIAKWYNISHPRAAYYHAYEHKLKFPTAETLYAQLAEGHTIASLAKLYACHPSTIRNRVPLYEPGKLTAYDIEWIQDNYTDFTQQELADVFGVTRSRIAQINPKPRKRVPYTVRSTEEWDAILQDLELLTIAEFCRKHKVSRTAVYQQLEKRA